MKHTLTLLSVLLLAPVLAFADEKPALLPPKHIGSPLPEHAVTNRVFTGIPSMAVAPKGRMWSTWYAGATGAEDLNNYVVLATSEDGGATWTEVLTIDPDGSGPVRNCDSELWVSPDGRLFVFWMQMETFSTDFPRLDYAGKGRHDTELGVWCMETSEPDTAQSKWSKPRRIADGVMMCKPLTLTTGEWVLPISTWRWHDHSAQMIVSTDAGKTWTLRGACNVPTADRIFDEHMFIERKDGSLWLLVRTKYGIGESVSTDRGKTWPELKPSSIVHPTSRFFIRRLASGNLLLVKHGPLDTRTGRSHLTAFISTDDGHTWGGGLLLDKNPGISYPDGQQTPDGLIHIIYDYNRSIHWNILMATFREEDVAAGKAVSDAVRLRQVVRKYSVEEKMVQPAAKPVKANNAAASSAGPDIAIEKNVMVRMRDGVALATDLYLPAKEGRPVEGKFPVILTRLPYGKSSAAKEAEYFARHGYIFVAQDTRGRYASEGEWHLLTDDGRDGADCAAWITLQPWSDGKIGMIGTSYVGGTQHAMALEHAPGLATVIPVDAMSNTGVQSMRNAGAFELRWWNWIMTHSGKGSRATRDPATAAMLKDMADHRLQYLANLPLRHGTTPLKFAPEYEKWLVEAMGHGANDRYFEQNNILDHADRYQDIPVYLVGGWYDSWAGNTTANFMALTRTLKSDVYLIMGPWIHGQQAQSTHGQVDFGGAAAMADELAWRLEWYDHWLKEKDNSVGKSAPFASKVRIFVMGTGDGHQTEKGLLFHGGQWRDEKEWPLARAKNTSVYLNKGGSLSHDKPAADSGKTSFTFDPANPVPTIGGSISSGDGILVQGAWDQRGGPQVWNWTQPVPLSARNDIVVFQSEPLIGDLEVTGPIEVKLWVSSCAVDTDFTAKLLDVYPASSDWPSGFDLNITDGVVRARFRESLKQEKLMEPGKIYAVTVQLYPTSNVFKKGHRIRVDVSSSNYPRFDVNPNTGEPLNDHRRTVTAVNTIHHDADHPSHLVLPVVPR